MTQRIKWKRTGLTIAVLCLLTYGLMLTGCGGGGGGENGVSSQVVSGVAATGAPMAGQVTIKNAANTTRATVIGSDGSFALDVTGMTGPYLLQATGNINGVMSSLYSFAGGPGTANINPLSSAAVASAAGVDDPAPLFTMPDSAVMQKIQANLPAAMAGIMTTLQPQLLQYGADGVDPIQGMYVANHIGLDAMFDNMRINMASGVVTVVAASNNGPRVLAAADGVPLYATYCQSCHGALASSEVRGASASRITTEIGSVSQMRTLSSLTSTQISNISLALSGTTTTTTTVPTRPTGVIATGGAGQVIISWIPVSNATSYYIYWRTASGVTTTNGTRITGAQSPYVLTGLTAGRTYYFIVTALNSAGQSSASSQVSATPTTGTGGTTPPPTTPDGAALYGTYCAGCHSALASSSKLGRTATQITAAISSVSQMSSLSSLTSAQISAIATALAGGGTTTTPPPPTSTDGAALYATYCQSCHNALATSQERNASASRITSAINGGVSQMSSLRTLTSTQITAIAAALSGTATTTIPVAPTGVIATGGTKQATISWSAVTGATSYNIYRSTTSGVTKTNGTKATGVTSPTVQTGLTDSTTYYYIVTAVNSAGESAASVQAAATTLASVPVTSIPSAPTGVSATGGAQQVTISWSPVAQAASYNIYWSTTPGVTTTTGSRLAGVSSPYVQTGLAVTNYYYIVTAVNSLGESPASAQVSATTTAVTIDGTALYGTYCAGCHNPLATSAKKGRTAAQISAAISSVSQMSSLSSLTSAQVSAIAAALAGTTTTTTIPAVPTSVVATGGTQQVTISWAAVTGATSYNTYWSTTSGVTKTSGAKLSSVANLAVQTGLADSTTYYYIVTAVNSAGESAASAQVTATTAAPSVTPPPPADGATLYGTYCASCHGVLASSAKQGRTAAQITAAITGNAGGVMNSLSSLTSTQISAIATALATVTPPPPPPPVGGIVSYATYIQPILNANCLSCHGAGNLTGYSFDTYANTVLTVVPGSATTSLLYQSLVGGYFVTQMPMQPLPQLNATLIQQVMDWINQGALNN